VSNTRVAFFTGGTTGAGHLARGIAIQRALARSGARAELGMFGPTSALHGAKRLDYHSFPVDPAELGDPARAGASALAAALAAFAPHVLIVDLFWAPLRLLLPLPACEAWLLVRRAPPVWLIGPPDHPFLPGQYARVIAIEPGAIERGMTDAVDPVVTVNREERRPVGALREALSLAADEALHVVHQAGEPGEWLRLAQSTSQRPIHVFAPGRDDAHPAAPEPGVHVHDGDAFSPLASWLGDADLLHTGAGYNAYWEARWLGYDAKTTFTPFRRNIDDQAWRLRTCASFVPRENGADMLVRQLRL
jgi:hypothetical protein